MNWNTASQWVWLRSRVSRKVWIPLLIHPIVFRVIEGQLASCRNGSDVDNPDFAPDIAIVLTVSELRLSRIGQVHFPFGKRGFNAMGIPYDLRAVYNMQGCEPLSPLGSYYASPPFIPSSARDA